MAIGGPGSARLSPEAELTRGPGPMTMGGPGSSRGPEDEGAELTSEDRDRGPNAICGSGSSSTRAGARGRRTVGEGSAWLRSAWLRFTDVIGGALAEGASVAFSGAIQSGLGTMVSGAGLGGGGTDATAGDAGAGFEGIVSAAAGVAFSRSGAAETWAGNEGPAGLRVTWKYHPKKPTVSTRSNSPTRRQNAGVSAGNGLKETSGCCGAGAPRGGPCGPGAPRAGPCGAPGALIAGSLLASSADGPLGAKRGS